MAICLEFVKVLYGAAEYKIPFTCTDVPQCLCDIFQGERVIFLVRGKMTEMCYERLIITVLVDLRTK